MSPLPVPEARPLPVPDARAAETGHGYAAAMSRVAAPNSGSDAAPARPSRANSRAALIAAALEEFSTKGYEAATVAAIAERAGVTTGALYAHFAGKLDLLLATVGLTPAAEVVDTIVGMVARPWSEASRIMSHGLATPPDRGTRLLLDVIVVARRDPHVARILRRGLETYLEAMRVANDKGVALGAIDPALRTDELARLFALITFGRIVFAALDEPPPSDEAFRRFTRSEEHTSELQSQFHLVCRLLLEKKKKKIE